MTTPPPSGPWVDRWLSAARHRVYLRAAGGDEVLALGLYEWNAQTSAALLRDLGHVEVALRNAYDRALKAMYPGPSHWTLDPRVFAPVYRTRGNGRVDINARPRDSLQQAIAKAGGTSSPPGKIVAELMFGFWRYLSSSAHSATLWVPGLYRAFAPGTSRRDIDRPVGRLHDLRNRVAHHEHLLGTDIGARLKDVTRIATLIDPLIGQHISSTSRVPTLLAQRPLT